MTAFWFTESCRAGSYSKQGLYCESCPIDTYKSRNDGSQCIKCEKWTNTTGKLGAVTCECKYTTFSKTDKRHISYDHIIADCII